MKKLLTLLLVTLLAVTALTCLMGITASAETYGDLTYSVSNGEVTITDCKTNASGSLTIHSEINGYPVTRIGSSAFSGCSGLTSVAIPDGVTSIGNSAFNYCNKLSSVVLSKNLKNIGDFAFAFCVDIANIRIPEGVESIGEYAFLHYQELLYL